MLYNSRRILLASKSLVTVGYEDNYDILELPYNIMVS